MWKSCGKLRVVYCYFFIFFFFSSRRRHTRSDRDWSSDVCSSDLFLNPGLSVSDVAYRLDYSSPQSFGRHLKAMLGVTAGEFRRRFPFDVSLERYVDLLVTPYRDTLRAFHPLNAGLWDQGPYATRVSRAG